MLTHLLSDIARDDRLKNRFAKEPSKVLDEYGVSEKARAALRSMDTTKVNRQLGRERKLLVSQASQRVMMPTPWPANGVSLISVSPATGTAGKSYSFTLKGVNFLPGVTVTFTRPGVTVTATNVVIPGSSTADASVLTCTATLPSVGAYTVTVTNLGSPPESDSAMQAFTAT